MNQISRNIAIASSLLLVSVTSALAASYDTRSEPVVVQKEHTTYIEPVIVQEAASIANNRHEGLYVGVNLGTNLIVANGDVHHIDHVLGVNANIGFDFNPFVGLEAGYTALEDELQMPYLAAKLGLPLGGNLRLQGKVGASYVMLKGDHEHGKYKKTEPYLGLGLSYALSNHVDIDATVQGASNIFDKHVVGVGVVGVGLTYHFS